MATSSFKMMMTRRKTSIMTTTPSCTMDHITSGGLLVNSIEFLVSLTRAQFASLHTFCTDNFLANNQIFAAKTSENEKRR